MLQKLLDTVDLRGNTPLMLCVLLRSKEVKILIKNIILKIKFLFF
jgi:hypothetical protein